MPPFNKPGHAAGTGSTVPLESTEAVGVTTKAGATLVASGSAGGAVPGWTAAR